MHSTPPFSHVQHAQDHTGDAPGEIAERNIRQAFILFIVFASIVGLGLIELVNHLHN